MKTITILEARILEDFKPGDKVCLVESYNNQDRRTFYTLHEDNFLPTKNMSGEICTNGWLGCTDGVDKTAKGFYRIEEINAVEQLSKEPIAGKRRKIVVGAKILLTKISDNSPAHVYP